MGIETVTIGHQILPLARQAGVWLPVCETRIHADTVFEAPVLLHGGIDNLQPIVIGAGSYSGSKITPSVGSIGRYCSIASHGQFGEMEHPTSWLTTSSFAYDADFIWKTFGEIHGRSYETIPLEQERKRGQIHIGNDVWIGRGAYIRGGTRVGDGAIVGTNAVVTKDVPPYAIVAGNPARIIRFRIPEKQIERAQRIAWWKYCYFDLDGIDLRDPEHALDQIERRI